MPPFPSGPFFKSPLPRGLSGVSGFTISPKTYLIKFSVVILFKMERSSLYRIGILGELRKPFTSVSKSVSPEEPIRDKKKKRFSFLVITI